MKRLKWINNTALMVSGLLSLGLLSACSDDDHSADEAREVTEINIRSPYVEFEPSSKLTVQLEGNGFSFGWTENDTLGILFPTGGLLPLPVSSANNMTADDVKFFGDKWGMSGGVAYIAYYPFHKETAAQHGRIIFDFTKQWQQLNNEYKHLAPYLMMASEPAKPQNGKLVLQLRYMGCFVRMDIPDTAPKEWASLSWVSDEPVFVTSGELDVNGTVPVFTPVEKNDTLTFSLDGVKTTEENLTTTLFFALPAINLEGKKVKIVLREKNRLETDYEVTIGKMEGGRAYHLGSLKPKQYPQFPQPNWIFDEDHHPYQSGMTAVVVLPPSLSERLGEGDELAAFMDNQLRGVGKRVGEKFYLMVHGDLGEKGQVTFKYYNKQQQFMYQALDCVEFDAEKIWGVADRPEVLPLKVVEE